jgi:hypothetical protein
VEIEELGGKRLGCGILLVIGNHLDPTSQPLCDWIVTSHSSLPGFEKWRLKNWLVRGWDPSGSRSRTPCPMQRRIVNHTWTETCVK